MQRRKRKRIVRNLMQRLKPSIIKAAGCAMVTATVLIFAWMLFIADEGYTVQGPKVAQLQEIDGEFYLGYEEAKK